MATEENNEGTQTDSGRQQLTYYTINSAGLEKKIKIVNLLGFIDATIFPWFPFTSNNFS